MTTAAHEDTLRRIAELADLEVEAWDRYRAELELLDGPAYDVAEPAAWDVLQLTLAEVGAERLALSGGPQAVRPS